MVSDSAKSNGSIGERIVAVQDKWHTKNHPFFGKLAEGALDLPSMGNYMAQHYKFVEMVLPSMGLLLWRAPEDIRGAMIENLAEEAGMAEDRNDHMEMIFRFCKAVGFGEDKVRTTQPTAAWWARALHYVHCCREEPLGVALAMQSTQEGQQVALNEEITLPAFQAHYGYQLDDPAIAFFALHAVADVEHSGRQLELAVKYLEPPEFERALEVCEVGCRLRWDSITEIYRSDVLGEDPIQPPGVG